MNSIIIPVFNVEKYLEKCLATVSELDPKKYEIIIINDGSTDNSTQIIEEWKNKLTNAKIIHKENGGLSSARNAGILEAKGEYLVFIDSDDYINSSKLVKLFDEAKELNVDIGIGEYCEFWEQDKACYHKSLSNNTAKITSEILNGQEFYKRYHHRIKSMVWRNVYRKEFLKENNLLFKEGIYFEDMVFTPLAFKAAKFAKYFPINFYYYRRRQDSITTSNSNLKKVLDSLEVWNILNSASIREDKQLSKVFNTIGFHSFIKHYLLNRSPISKHHHKQATTLSLNTMIKKYKIIAIFFRILPQKAFLNLLSFMAK